MEFRRLLICVMDSFSSCNCTWSWWPAPVCFDKAVRKSESSSVLNRGFTVTKCLFGSQLSTNIRNSSCLFNLNFILPLFNVFFNLEAFSIPISFYFCFHRFTLQFDRFFFCSTIFSASLNVCLLYLNYHSNFTNFSAINIYAQSFTFVFTHRTFEEINNKVSKCQTMEVHQKTARNFERKFLAREEDGNKQQQQ